MSRLSRLEFAEVILLGNSRRSMSGWAALIYAVVGGVVGSIVGGWLRPLWAPLGHAYLVVGTAGGHPWTLDLQVVGVQFGIWLDLNVVAMAGILAGLWIYQRSR